MPLPATHRTETSNSQNEMTCAWINPWQFDDTPTAVMFTAVYGKFVAIRALQIRQLVQIRLAVIDRVVAALTVQAADGGIIIDRTPFDAVQRVDIARAQVDHRQTFAAHRVPDGAAPGDIGRRIEEDIDDLSARTGRRIGA